jgi:hypothetical protein
MYQESVIGFGLRFARASDSISVSVSNFAALIHVVTSLTR